MIRFTLVDVEEIYLSLIGLRREEDKEVDEILSFLPEEARTSLRARIRTRAPRYVEFSSGRIIIPLPVEQMDVRINSNGQNYVGKASVGIGELRGRIKLLETNPFQRLDIPNLVILGENAILIGKEGIPLYNLSQDYPVQVDFGKGGTLIRRLGNVEQFEADMNNWMDITGKFVNAICGDTPDINYQIDLKKGIQ